MERQDGSAPEITRLLKAWRTGDSGALDQLMSLVYNELHTLAARQLAREWRPGRMQTTVVVNEAYLKLFGQREVDWENRGHFFAIAAQLMRRILVDHARRELRQKHGGAAVHLGLDVAADAPQNEPVDVVEALALDRALRKLERLDPVQAQVVELRFFAGMTVEEAGAAMGVSAGTIKREWSLAKGWLHRELTGAPADGGQD